MRRRPVDTGIRPLPSAGPSLAVGVPRSAPSTLYALALSGGVVAAPAPGRTIRFGRNRPQVHVCMGEDDAEVSRTHGLLTHRDGSWSVANTGRRPIRVAGERHLFPGEEEIPLRTGYTPLFVGGSGHREHLLEVYVTGAEGNRPRARHEEETRPPRTWLLKPDERLALIVLGQRYLWHDFHPQPLTWRQTAEQLRELQPDANWTPSRVAHLVEDVRIRLSRGGVPGLTREEVGEPVGNLLNHNLIRELMLSTTLVPRDLALLDEMIP
jgi:hypothetical protein